MIMKKFLWFIVVCLFIPCSLYSDEKYFRVAVIGISGNNVSQYEVQKFKDYLELALFENKKFTVLERKQIEVIFREQNIKTGECVSTSCFVNLGQALSANYLINGSLDKKNGNYHIIIKGISVRDSKIVFIESIILKEDDMKKIAKNVSNVVSKKIIEKVLPAESYSFYVSSSFNYLIPHKVLSIINKNGYGFNIEGGIQIPIMNSFTYLLLGLNSGYYYFQAENSANKLSIIPVALDINIQFKINNYFYIAPGIGTGINCLKFSNSIYTTEFSVKPLINLGLTLNTFDIFVETSYNLLYEKDELLSYLSFNVGITYHL